MATKKSKTKTSRTKTESKTNNAESIEKAIERGIESGINNIVNNTIKKKYNYSCNKEINNSCGWVYFLGIVGAAIYYISNATGFWNGVLGILKAIVWPAMIVLKILGL